MRFVKCWLILDVNNLLKGYMMKKIVLLLLVCLLIPLANAHTLKNVFHRQISQPVARTLEGTNVTSVKFSNSANGPFTSPATIVTQDSLFVQIDVTPLGSATAYYYFDANMNGVIDASDLMVGSDIYSDNATSSSGVVDYDPTEGVIAGFLKVGDAPAMHVICRVVEGATEALGILVFANSPKTYTLSGTVFTKDGAPIAGARVWAGDSTGTGVGSATDTSGAYSLPVDAGSYAIEVGDFAGNRFSGKETTMVITGNTIQNFYLSSLNSYIRGYVKDQHANPIANVNVWTQNSNNGTETDANGMYKLMVSAGSSNIGLSQDNLIPTYMVPNSRSYTIGDNDSIVNNSTSNFICYTTNATITGIVRENGLMPTRIYEISAWANGLDAQSYAFTNGMGEFTLPVYSTGSAPTYGVNVASWDDSYPIPPGMYVDTMYNSVLPGGTVSFNIISAETLLVEPFNGTGNYPYNTWYGYDYNNPWGSGAVQNCMNDRLEVLCNSMSGLSGLGLHTQKPYSLTNREYRILVDNSEMMNSNNTVKIVLTDENINGEYIQNVSNSLQLIWEQSPLGTRRWRLARSINGSYSDLWVSTDSVGHYVLFTFSGTDSLILRIDGNVKYAGPWGHQMSMAYLFLTEFNVYPNTATPVYFDEVFIGAIGTTGVKNAGGEIPNAVTLDQNYPNPFNPSTAIHYQVAANSFVTLKVFNLLGQEVVTLVNAQQNPGNYDATLTANVLPSGVYYYRLSASDPASGKQLMNEVRKAILVK